MRPKRTKMNCKHGLDRKQEIQARRLRQKIEEGNYGDLKERLFDLYSKYGLKICGSFYDYIKENDLVLYSAFERIGGIATMYDCLEQCRLI